MLHLTMMMHMKCMQFLNDHIASVNMKKLISTIVLCDFC